MKKLLLALIIGISISSFSCSKSDDPEPDPSDDDKVQVTPGHGRVLLTVSRSGIAAKYSIVQKDNQEKIVEAGTTVGSETTQPLKDCKRQSGTIGMIHDIPSGEYIIKYELDNNSGQPSIGQTNLKVEEGKCQSINLLGVAWGS